MYLPNPTIDYFRAKVAELMPALLDAWHAGETVPSTAEDNPQLLARACDQWLEAFAAADASDTTVDPESLTQFGEYGLNLCHSALSWAQQLGQNEITNGLQEMTIVFALWLVRRGGELHTLEPVVDGLAKFANTTANPEELENLYTVMNEILNAVTPAIRNDLEKTNPGRPWRILNLNRAIVATRTHQPALMEQAFKEFVETLPEEAPQFFTEGMAQMDLLNYPPHVRTVMDKYYQQWGAEHALH
jgi:hypothetical protein